MNKKRWVDVVPVPEHVGYELFVVDAFAERPGDGNPAAVILIGQAAMWPSEKWMIETARAFRTSTRDLVELVDRTAQASVRVRLEFNDPREKDGSRHADSVTRVVFLRQSVNNGGYKIRWKTVDGDECPLCGHGSIAAASVLFSSKLMHSMTIEFSTLDDVKLTVGRKCIAEKDVLIISMPKGSVVPLRGTSESINARWRSALFPDPGSFSHTKTKLITHVGVTAPLGDELFVVRDVATLRGMQPDIHALLYNIKHSDGHRRGVIATTATGCMQGYAFESRFWDANGCEDPVTGSIHAALGPFWASRCALDCAHPFTAFQTSPAMRRSGSLSVHVRAGHDVVDVGGSAVVVAHGRVART